jgi:YVTN family beta-propeller protein
MHRLRGLVVVLSLILFSFSCSLQQSSGAAPPQPDTPTAEPPAATPVNLDLCELLTTAEVSEALQEPVEVQPGLQTGACSYATTGGAQPKSVSVSAAQGSQARDLVQMSASVGLLFGANYETQKVADDLKANAASMSLQEVVEKANRLLVPIGYTYSAAGNQTTPAIWGWNPMGAGSLEQVDGETFLAVSVVGLDEQSALSLATRLLALADARLPAAFTIDLAESLQVQFTAEVPASTQVPTATPEPSVNRTIWVADRMAGRVARIDAATGNILAVIGVGSGPASIAIGEGAVWVANQGDGTVSRIDPAANQTVASIPVGQKGFLRVAAGEGRVWVAACLDKVVKVIDPATNAVTASVPAEGCWNVAVGGGQVWVPVGEQYVLHINPSTLSAIPNVIVQSGPSEIVSGFGSMWVANVNAMTVSRIDPLSREVTATLKTGLDHAEDSLRGLATGEGRVWLSSTAGVLGFDPDSDTLAVTFSTVADPWFMATAGGALWVTTDAPGGIFALDPTDGALLRQVPWGTAPFAIAAGP